MFGIGMPELLIVLVVALLVLGIVPGMITEVAGAFFEGSEAAAAMLP